MDIFLAILWQFINLLKEIIPYFLLSVVLAAFLATFVKPKWGSRFFDGNIVPVFLVSFFAALLPGCACATMPMAESLQKRGIKTGTLVAFIAMSPLLAPQTIILTYGMLGWKFAAFRVLASFVFIPIFGILLNLWTPEQKIISPSTSIFIKHEHNGCGTNNGCCADNTSRIAVFWRHFREISLNIGKYFVIGLAIAAVFSVLVPREILISYVGSSTMVSYLLSALIGIPIYVCEGEEILIAFSLLNNGLGAGPTFTFILASVGTCIPTILMAKKMLGGKITLIYLIFWFMFVISAGFIFEKVI